MMDDGVGHVAILAPDESALSDLPAPDTVRWVARRKAAVLRAIDEGRLTLAQARARYNLTEEELAAWGRLASRYGTAGLRSTRVQYYRQVERGRTTVGRG